MQYKKKKPIKKAKYSKENEFYFVVQEAAMVKGKDTVYNKRYKVDPNCINLIPFKVNKECKNERNF